MGCSAPKINTPPKAEPSPSIGSQSVILSPKQTEEYLHSQGLTNADQWSPTGSDVADLKVKLDSFLQEKYPDLWQNIDTYVRQYIGATTENGERAIIINFFCDDHGYITNFDWRNNVLQVLDGGDCYFQTLYNVDSENFDWLIINGES